MEGGKQHIKIKKYENIIYVNLYYKWFVTTGAVKPAEKIVTIQMVGSIKIDKKNTIEKYYNDMPNK